MSVSLDQTLRDWRDFYVMGGTAAATLVGLMFVFASIGASQLARRNLGAMRAFITPTVVHFGAALFVCLVSIMPGHSERSLGGVLGVGALIGVAYCGQIFVLIFRRFAAGLAWEDRLFYALIPLRRLFPAARLGAGRTGRAPRRRQHPRRRRDHRADRRRAAQRLGHDGVDDDARTDDRAPRTAEGG